MFIMCLERSVKSIQFPSVVLTVSDDHNILYVQEANRKVPVSTNYKRKEV